MTLPPSDQPHQWPQQPSQQPQNQQPQNQQWPSQPWPSPASQPSRAQASRGRNTLLGALVGLLVAALVVGGLTLAGVVHWGSDSTSADTRAVELPQNLGELTEVGAAALAKSPERGGAMGTMYQHTYARTAERYGVAFGGAGVGVRTYTNDDLELFLTVIAVRADSPGLFNGPQADPADLGIVAQPSLFDLVVDGDVQCLQTVTQVVTEGKQVQDEDLLPTLCRTTGPGLTVYVHGGGGNKGSEGRQRMVDLARAARTAIAGT